MRLFVRTLLSLGVGAVTMAGCQYLPLPDMGQVPPAVEVADAPVDAGVVPVETPISDAPIAETPVPPVSAEPLEASPSAPLTAAPPATPAPPLESHPPAEPDIAIQAEPVPAIDPVPEPAAPAAPEPAVAVIQPAEDIQSPLVESLCEEVGNKLGSVSVQDCLRQQLQLAGGMSVNQRPLVKRDFLPQHGAPVSRILIMGGIHGDEYSSISIMFKWMDILAQQGSSFHWRFLPVTNPDGLLDGQAVRQNANGVDLNRNFPSADWHASATSYWKNRTGSNPRRFPGHAPASEPEVQWVVEQIREFAPQVIVSVHAPYDLLDFDGPAEAPKRIGQLYLNQLGVYPGSLGNYGGVDLNIPVVTLELPSAGIMPSRENIQAMWDDLETWLSINSMSLTSSN